MNLVTGATGHIGNVLVRQLLGQGEPVRALVRAGSQLLALNGLDVEIARGDILDPETLENAMRGVDMVYHLAARISLTPYPEPEMERINLEGTRNVIQAMRRQRVRRLVYAGSVYALKRPADGAPIDERQPFEVEHSQGAYDASKARASLAVLEAIAGGLEAVIVCPTAVAGPYDFHASEVGRAIQLYMRPGLKFVVDGAYDFVDVRDVARGCILAACKGKSGETYILGGERMTLAEVAQIVWEATGMRPPHLKIPIGLAYFGASLMQHYTDVTGARPLFTRYSLDAIRSNSRISHEKAAREFGYWPRPARKAILDTVRWFQAKEGEDVFLDLEQPQPGPAQEILATRETQDK